MYSCLIGMVLYTFETTQDLSFAGIYFREIHFIYTLVDFGWATKLTSFSSWLSWLMVVGQFISFSSIQPKRPLKVFHDLTCYQVEVVRYNTCGRPYLFMFPWTLMSWYSSSLSQIQPESTEFIPFKCGGKLVDWFVLNGMDPKFAHVYCLFEKIFAAG